MINRNYQSIYVLSIEHKFIYFKHNPEQDINAFNFDDWNWLHQFSDKNIFQTKGVYVVVWKQ
jgi:hypothetical protein